MLNRPAPALALAAFLPTRARQTVKEAAVGKGKSLRIPDDPIGNALAKEGERGSVLVGSSFIEYNLEELLRAEFSRTVSERNRKLIEGNC
jgi:hypothetical protein